jgi:type IV secretory pathway TraG/TraD family ATPase VirD4
MNPKTIYGGNIYDNTPPKLSSNDFMRFNGTFQGASSTFGMSEWHLDKHTLLLGTTGCGKTTLMNKMIEQTIARLTPNDVMIIFDSKGDFYTKFGGYKKSYVIGNSKQYFAQSLRWNIMSEILFDVKNDRDVVMNAQEISKILFADREKRTNNPFFPNAARDLFASLLIFLARTGTQDKNFAANMLFNDKLKDLLERSTADDIMNFLSFDKDLTSVSSYISGGGDQANGVLSEMYSVVRDILIGVFAEKGNFSIKDFVRRRGANVLFIEYDLSIGQSLTPIYRLLIDLALKEVLGRPSSAGASGNVYLFCDEFRLVPHLQHIDDGVNFGRSLGLKIFAGIQSVEQIYELYDESRGRNILTGFSNLFAFRTFDPSTMKYIRERSGRNVVMDQMMTLDRRIQDNPRDSYTVEDWNLYTLGVGEAIVSLAFGEPFRFQFTK